MTEKPRFSHFELLPSPELLKVYFKVANLMIIIQPLHFLDEEIEAQRLGFPGQGHVAACKAEASACCFIL